MGVSRACLYLFYFIFFLPICFILLLLGIIKVCIFSPFVYLIITFGAMGVIVASWPVHLFWSIYCLIRTKKFGLLSKIILILLVPIAIAVWTVVGVYGSLIMCIWYAVIWPILETFRAISREGVPIYMRLIRCFTDGTWTNVWGACTVVRDYGDFSFHSYFSVMDELLESDGEEPIDAELMQILGCIVAAILGILVDVPVFTLIVLCKVPIMLFKGWMRLIDDLIGREGPFLEKVCVPFAGLWILLWPAVVIVSAVAGVLSSFGFGCYSAVIAYQENSIKKGLLYAIASISIFDEYTNDVLYLREGSCFPRPRYSDRVGSSSYPLPVQGLLEQPEAIRVNEPLPRTPSGNAITVKAVMIRDTFIKACEEIGKELLREGAIGLSDLEAWRQSKNKIVNIGIPAYAFLECFLCSIKNNSPGFILRDNLEITRVNRPEGRVFDWLYDPMCTMKEQIRSLNLGETEELYFYKYCLFSGDAQKMESWQNGGIPPEDGIKRAQLEGISRRLQGFCLTLSRLPTSRRRFFEIVKAIEQEAKNSVGIGSRYDIEAAV
ncbi:Steroid nuclear receptor ligand-binding [Quillaja saponaria]|uniref:Steroid nuclear receptor ligand-binding n=1 Tax=Quillaja saponaria TaxID=32244 RepID=A0AAD7L7E8_QUISA|nr:Steroid nuclear receptor ligand-binding [Quillaja saponaria]